MSAHESDAQAALTESAGERIAFGTGVTADSRSQRPSSGNAPGGHGGGTVAPRWSVAARVLAVIVGVVLAIQGLRLARPVMLPLVGGIFLAILARPLHLRVREALPRRLRWLGLVVAMLAMLAGVGALGTALVLSGRVIADELRSRRPQIEAGIERIRSAADRAGLPMPSALEGGASRTPAQPGQPAQDSARAGRSQNDSTASSSGSSDTTSRALRTAIEALTGLGLALAFAALGLAEATEVRRRIAHAARGASAEQTLAAVDEAASAFRRYVWVKSLTSAITGLATWLAALAFGLPLAWVWGFLAFLLEYVPSVGSLLAVIPPTLMALADGGPGRAAVVLLVIGTLQIILGNVVDPRLEGRLMAISPFGVLLSIVFWGWLWGPVGALLAVPLTVAIVIACRHIPGAQGFATVVAGDGVPDDRES